MYPEDSKKARSNQAFVLIKIQAHSNTLMNQCLRRHTCGNSSGDLVTWRKELRHTVLTERRKDAQTAVL